MATTVKNRWAEIKGRPLLKGAHDPDGEMCIMEAVAYVAGEKWSDHPECVCPIIGGFLRQWNDDMNDTDRQMLKPYITRLVGTRRTKDVEQRRGWMLADWMIRVHTPAWLELAGMKEQADAIRSLPEICDPSSLDGSMPALRDAKEKAAAAWDAAWAAAWDAAWDAARDAAWAAAWAAARDAARAAAWDAAWDAARAAAWAAAGKRLEPTKVALQASALELLDRLIECK